MISHNPLHRSGRAGFPNPAPTSGDDAHATQRKRMMDAHRRQPAVDQTQHPFPGIACTLTTPRQPALPEPDHLHTERIQRPAVHGHAVIAEMPTYDRSQPPAYFWDGVVHAQPEFGFH